MLSACSGNLNNRENEDVFYKEIKDIKRVSATNLFVAEAMMTDIECVNDYIVLCSEHNEKLIYIYTNDGEFITSVGNKGRASDEMLSISFNGQKSELESVIYAIDANGMKNIEIDIQKSIDINKLVFNKSYKTLPYSINSFIKDDSTLLVEQVVENNYIFHQLCKDEIYESKDMYDPADNSFILYRGFCSYSPLKNKAVWAMNSINSIYIIDLDTWSKKTISVYTKPNMNNVINPKTKTAYHRYYCNVATTDKYIYALYMDQQKEDSYSKEKEMEIHVLDWDGKLIHKLIVDKYIIRLTVDNDDQYIYAMDINDNIYKLSI